MKLNIDLNTNTILENDGVFKLADYKLLFHPCNIPSKNKNIEYELINKMKYVIFDILELKNKDARDNFEETCNNLISHLK